jgi:sugar phosphate isomerase/epimerase
LRLVSAHYGYAAGSRHDGDGVIDIRSHRQAIEALGYTGLHEVEIFSSNNWWQRDPDEVLAICKQRHREFG